MTGTFEEIDKLRSGNVVFAQSECLYRNDTLRTLGIKAALLILRTAHQKCARRNPDHHGAIWTFPKFAIFPRLRVTQT
jgi:hypothetical protein